MTRPFRSLLPLPVLFVLALGSWEPREGYDLRPQMVVGQTLSAFNEVSGTFELLESDVAVGEETLPEAFLIDVEFSGSDGSETEVLVVEDDEVRSLRITFTDEEAEVSGDVGIMGNNQSFDESRDAHLLGRTVLLETDEDGEITTTELTDDESLEPLSDSDLSDFDLRSHYWMLLPEEPVEVGESWDIGESLYHMLEDNLDGYNLRREADEPDADELVAGFDILRSSTAFEFIGTLQSVEDRTANLRWVFTMTVDELDLVEFVREAGQAGDLEDLPVEDFEILTSATAEFVGSGQFDLESGQLTHYEFSGDHTVTLSGSMHVEGHDVEFSLEFEGSLDLSGGVTVD